MVGAGSKWAVAVSVAILCCLVLQACTTALWEETQGPECRRGYSKPVRIGFAILLTPITLFLDTAMVVAMAYARGPC